MNTPDRPARPGPASHAAARPPSGRAATAPGRGADEAGALETLGRSSGPASLILSSLADGPKHGYALTKDIESFAAVRLAPGTLYVEAVESQDRRRPYRLTATGATALSTYLEAQRKVAEVGLRRLAGSWALT